MKGTVFVYMLQDRVNERFRDYENALKKLKESTELVMENDIIIDGVIQRFEFTFELSWKLMKTFLEYEGIEELNSPRVTLKYAYKRGLIEDGDEWINMMIDRNRTSHIYDEKTAKEIYVRIKTHHILLLENFLDKMKEVM